jgi:ABC-type lipoprotein export system ATPase subunit
MLKYLVRCANLIKIYKVADLEAIALQGLDLEVAPGEMIALVGASGSGKTTLLNILGGLDVPTAGQASVGDYDLTRLSEEQRTRYRNLVVGYLWQQSGRNLLPDLTIADNVDLPQILNGTVAFHSSQRTFELLELVGLKGMEKKRPAQLSGGEQQRAAIAVALANRPALLLADEPTGELDSVTARGIIACLRQINMQFGLTIILVTHDVAVASGVDRTLAIRDGRINTETVRRNAPLTHEEAALDGARSKGTSTASPRSLRRKMWRSRCACWVWLPLNAATVLSMRWNSWVYTMGLLQRSSNQGGVITCNAASSPGCTSSTNSYPILYVPGGLPSALPLHLLA